MYGTLTNFFDECAIPRAGARTICSAGRAAVKVARPLPSREEPDDTWNQRYSCLPCVMFRYHGCGFCGVRVAWVGDVFLIACCGHGLAIMVALARIVGRYCGSEAIHLYMRWAWRSGCTF